jgi:hypothetical protein
MKIKIAIHLDAAKESVIQRIDRCLQNMPMFSESLENLKIYVREITNLNDLENIYEHLTDDSSIVNFAATVPPNNPVTITSDEEIDNSIHPIHYIIAEFINQMIFNINKGSSLSKPNAVINFIEERANDKTQLIEIYNQLIKVEEGVPKMLFKALEHENIELAQKSVHTAMLLFETLILFTLEKIEKFIDSKSIMDFHTAYDFILNNIVITLSERKFSLLTKDPQIKQLVKQFIEEVASIFNSPKELISFIFKIEEYQFPDEIFTILKIMCGIIGTRIKTIVEHTSD